MMRFPTPAIRAGFVWAVAAFVLACLIAQHMAVSRMPPHGWTDVWVYFRAATNFIHHPSQLYDTAVRQLHTDLPTPAYLYPPSGLVLFLPLVPLADAAGLIPAMLTWVTIDALALIAAIVLIGRQLRLRADVIGLATLVVLVGLPASWEINSGQVNGIVLLLLALTFRTYPRPSSGVLLGLALAVKPIAPLLLVVPVLRGHWRVALVALATVLAVNVAMLPFLGLAAARFYATTFLPFFANFSAHEPGNISVENVLQTWIGGRTQRVNLTHPLSPLRLTAVATAILWALRAVELAALAVVARSKRFSHLDLFAITLATIPLFTATVWFHYVLYAIPLFLVVLARARGWSRAALLVAGAAALWRGIAVPPWLLHAPIVLHGGSLDFLQRQLAGPVLAIVVLAVVFGPGGVPIADITRHLGLRRGPRRAAFAAVE